MDPAELIKRFRVDDPGHFRLKRCDPADTCGLDFDIEKDEAKAMLRADIARMVDLQKRLYAGARWAVLLVLQGMDTSGKDGVVNHVMAGINPQGCDVHSFSAPSAEELDHDYLWRAHARLPRQGRIGIFNRSYYEEVLVVRVREELLAEQKLPPQVVGKRIWKQRFEDINAFERYLMRNGTLILKFFLNISKGMQKQRFLERIDDPSKRWKFSMNDVEDRQRWDEYMVAYEDMIRHTSEAAPWHVVPADNKWFARLTVASVLVDALDRLKLEFPKVEGTQLRRLQRARRALVAEGGGKAHKAKKAGRES